MVKSVGIVAIALLSIGFVVAAGWGIKYYTADIRGKINANEQIKSGSNRIVQYDKFFNECWSIRGLEGSLDASLGELETATTEDNKQRIQTNITGLKAARSQAIANYNADAAKNYTGGQFRDSDLPYQIKETDYIKGYRTSCAS